MLRVRLFYGLLTLVLLLWGLGAAALLLLKDSNQRFADRLMQDYPPIKAAQSFRLTTSQLNTYYVATLAEPVARPPKDRKFFDDMKGDMAKNIASLSKGPVAATDGVRALEQAVGGYEDGYEQFFAAKDGGTAEQRAQMLQQLSGSTLRISEAAQSVMNSAEKSLFLGARQLTNESFKNVLFIIVLGMMGTAVAVIIYFQLVRHVVDPVSGLQRSIEEIRKGRFELTMPEVSYGSEFRAVISAFNEMAAELKHRRGESDDRLTRTNLVNRAILQAIPSPVFVLGPDGRVLQVNPAAEHLNEALGVDDRLPAKIQRIVDDCRITGENHAPEDPREAVLFRLNEKEYYYLPRIFSFTSDDHSRSGIAVLLHNVTRIRWLDDMKTNLLSTVSHEIKTPLTGIRMVLLLLLEERTGALSSMQQTMISSASEDCERLLATLNTLLDLSRAESGTTHLDRVPTSLQAAVVRAQGTFTSLGMEKNVRLLVEGKNDLPDVYADPMRLDEVLNNLVSNAIKHSPASSEVVMRLAEADAEHLRVSVIDHGTGVPEALQGRIFERFFRAPGQEVDGVGLGLFISREIMRAHEGRIGLLERSEDQTEFYIDVPIA
jgi:NtrC-family two-component system sensor histidine kinase KinB